MFAWKNSDTWMHPVRQLIRDSTPPLSPNLEERRVHTHKHMYAHIEVHKAAGGHFLLDKSKQARSTASHWMDIGKTEM